MAPFSTDVFPATALVPVGKSPGDGVRFADNWMHPLMMFRHSALNDGKSYACSISAADCGAVFRNNYRRVAEPTLGIKL